MSSRQYGQGRMNDANAKHSAVRQLKTLAIDVRDRDTFLRDGEKMKKTKKLATYPDNALWYEAIDKQDAILAFAKDDSNIMTELKKKNKVKWADAINKQDIQAYIKHLDAFFEQINKTDGASADNSPTSKRKTEIKDEQGSKRARGSDGIIKKEAGEPIDDDGASEEDAANIPQPTTIDVFQRARKNIGQHQQSGFDLYLLIQTVSNNIDDAIQGFKYAMETDVKLRDENVAVQIPTSILKILLGASCSDKPSGEHPLFDLNGPAIIKDFTNRELLDHERFAREVIPRLPMPGDKFFKEVYDSMDDAWIATENNAVENIDDIDNRGYDVKKYCIPLQDLIDDPQLVCDFVSSNALYAACNTLDQERKDVGNMQQLVRHIDDLQAQFPLLHKIFADKIPQMGDFAYKPQYQSLNDLQDCIKKHVGMTLMKNAAEKSAKKPKQSIERVVDEDKGIDGSIQTMASKGKNKEEAQESDTGFPTTVDEEKE